MVKTLNFCSLFSNNPMIASNVSNFAQYYTSSQNIQKINKFGHYDYAWFNRKNVSSRKKKQMNLF